MQHTEKSRLERLVEAGRSEPTLRTAIVHPCDALSLRAAIEAGQQGLIAPILVGPKPKIEAIANQHQISLKNAQIEDAPHSHAAAEMAVAITRAGKADAIMKGKLHTDEFMPPILNRTTGLRTGRQMSHAYLFDVPLYPKGLLITDAALNIYPNLMQKRDIVQNAIDLMQALDVSNPKVAILSATESISPNIQSTVDAAALCKMSDRGQICGGVLDGPLAFDNAISREAANTKGIESDVAGDADIFLVPDLEAGNMLAKQLIYLAEAIAAGLVIGARVPVILTSRADNQLARLASCALAQRYAAFLQQRSNTQA